jgi:hypothetical protein
MQKSKILQTLSVVGLTAVCSIQSAQAAWEKEILVQEGIIGQRNAGVKWVVSATVYYLGRYHPTDRKSGDLARGSTDLNREQNMSNMVVSALPNAAEVVPSDVVGSDVAFFINAKPESGEYAQCNLTTIYGLNNYVVTEQDVGKQWDALMGELWPHEYSATLSYPDGYVSNLLCATR